MQSITFTPRLTFDRSSSLHYSSPLLPERLLPSGCHTLSEEDPVVCAEGSGGQTTRGTAHPLQEFPFHEAAHPPTQHVRLRWAEGAPGEAFSGGKGSSDGEGGEGTLQ